MTDRIPITTGFDKQNVIGWMQLGKGIQLDPELYKLTGAFEYNPKRNSWELVEVAIVPKFDRQERDK